MHALRSSSHSRNALLAAGLGHHREGRLDDAASSYQELHAADPGDSEVIFLMGVLCQDLGLFEPARLYLEQALALAPEFPEARTQLMIAINAQASLDLSAGELTAARRNLDRALLWAPDDPTTLRNLARAALLEGNAAAAEVLFSRSLAKCPEHAETLNELGLALMRQEKFPAAEVSLRATLRLRPDHDQARNNLGLVLYQLGRLDEARGCFETVLARDPTYRNARINWAVTMRTLGHLPAARGALEAVLAEQPDEIDALNNLGIVFQDLGESDSAMRTLTRAFALSPAIPQVRWNLALTRLLHGDFCGGWELYESRWEGCEHLRRGYRYPVERAWHGQHLAGKRLLLWWEQGFGDTLQFIRFAGRLAGAGASVAVVVQRELRELARSAAGVARVFTDEEPAEYDFHCPLMSLPYRLGVSLERLDLGGGAYLSAPPQRVHRWAQRLAPHPGLKVGLVWAGNSRRQTLELRAVDLRRSLPLAALTPLLAVGGCSFFSLQKGDAFPERLRIAEAAGSVLHDFTDEWADFADTAAFVANLDLVISVDTAVAHLAGALGKPVWLLNRYDTCWRWLRDRDDSPWYPTLRQFRQSRWGEWGPVITRAAAALEELAGRSNTENPQPAPD